MIQPAQPLQTDDGFTVLEMLVVLVVMAIVAAIAWPRVTSPSPALSVKTSALRLAAEMRSTRADAMRDGEPRAVTVDVARRTFWSGVGGPQRRLGSPLRISASGRNLVWSTPQRVQVVFKPDGSSSGGALLLRAGAVSAAVHVDWMTGATTVTKGR